MKKYIPSTLVVLFVASIMSYAVNYTFVKQPPQSQRIGFGAVVGSTATGSVAISSCDGAATVTGERSLQIGTGTTSEDDTFRFRDNVIVDEDGATGIVPYGLMQLKYVFWQEEFIESGYRVDGATTNVTGDLVYGGTFSETANSAPWLLSVVDGGGDDDELVEIMDDSANGVLKMETTDQTLDSLNAQLNGEAFKMAVGKELWFNSKWAAEDVSANTNTIGLAIADTDIIASLPADHMVFENRAGDLYFSIGQNSTPTTFDTGVDLVDGTMVTTAVYWDGVSSINVYVDGTLITNIVDNGTTIIFPDDVAMSPIMAVQTTGTGKDYMLVDYIGCYQTR